MDTSDEFYARLHRKHEMGEKKQKLRETDKMVQARNKLKARIELLEVTEDVVWAARMEKLLKKAARYAGDEEEAPDLGNNGPDEGSNDCEKETRKGVMTEDELAEKVQRLVLLAGLELVKRTTAEQLKEELIIEGKELLEKYNRTLGMYVKCLGANRQRADDHLVQSRWKIRAQRGYGSAECALRCRGWCQASDGPASLSRVGQE